MSMNVTTGGRLPALAAACLLSVALPASSVLAKEKVKTGDAARMIQMCDNCRVNAQYHSENSPFAGAERPRPRTTADYLSKRKDH